MNEKRNAKTDARRNTFLDGNIIIFVSQSKTSVFYLITYCLFLSLQKQFFTHQTTLKSNLKTRCVCFLPSLSLPMLLMLLLLPNSSRRTVCRFVAETVAVVTFHSSKFHRRTISLEVTNFPALFTSFSLGIKRVRQNARTEKKH